MRRSRSLSNIPMPLNVRRDSKVKRAKSTLRNSRDPSLDGQTPLARRLETPTSSYKLGTPSSFTGFKRSGSVSSFGSRVSLTKNRSPLEKKSMQKLLNDKKWVAEQYTKVQHFIQTSGLFNPELSGMIRPPTINTVAELFSVLFRQLIKTDPINSQSYGDVALRTLKLLNYPGTITLSTLKTANTMHGWPHFISIMSWLIERVDLDAINTFFREQQNDETKQMFNMQDSVFEFLTLQHSIYTVGNGVAPDKELIAKSDQNLYEHMSLFTGTDLEAVKSLEQPIETLVAEVAELESQLQELSEENQKLQAQSSERRELIKKFQGSSSTKEQDLEVELSQLRKSRHKLTEKKKNLELSIKELETIAANQSGRYDEKIKLLGQIEDLTRAINRKERKLLEYRALKDELDHELTAMVNEVEMKVDAWNVSITKTLLPEMQKLHLREKGFHSTSFIKELREIIKEKNDVTKQLLQEYKTISLDVEKIEKKRKSFEKNATALNVTKEKIDSLIQSVQILMEERRNLLFKIGEIKTQFDANIMDIESLGSSKIKEAETGIAELNDRIQKITERTDESAKKGVCVLLEAHNMAIHNMKRIDEVMHSMLKDVTERAEQSRNNLAETYKYFLKIEENTAIMLQKVNVEPMENTA